MHTRRNLLLGVGNALLGGGLVTRGAFSSSVDAGGDMRVVMARQCPKPGLRLKPGREDEAYVLTDGDGYVEEIVLDGFGVAGDGLNRTAESRFERLVRVCNTEGPAIDELRFEFEVVDDGLAATDPTPADIEEALFIASAGGDVAGDGSTDFIDATDHGQLTDDEIAAGEELSFGVGVDLLPSSTIQNLPDPGAFTVKLHIEADAKNRGRCRAK